MDLLMDDPECPGPGLCHGCLKWCDVCGDVGETCDTRLYGEKDGRDHGLPSGRTREWCDCHPVPPPARELQNLLRNAESEMAKAKRAYEETARQVEYFRELASSRRELDRQIHELDEAVEIVHGIMER